MNSYKILLDVRVNCESNQSEAALIYKYLVNNNHKITYNPSEADFIIIISCGVIEQTRLKYKQIVDKYNSMKRDNTKVILFGCLVKIDKKLVQKMDVIPISFEERKKLDEIFLNTKKIEKIKPSYGSELRRTVLDIKFKYSSELKTRSNITDLIIQNRRHLLVMFLSLISKKIRKRYKIFNNFIESKNSFFVEINRGCTGKCSYCVVKRAKGNVKSSRIKEIIEEIDNLYEPKKDLFLISEDCACFGLDNGENLIDLIYEINKKYPYLTINLNYLSPRYLEKYSEEYIKLFKNVNINFVIIPVESGSNKIIENMNRHYDIKKIMKIIYEIKKVSPKTVIMTDFIAGFPGEKSIDFIKTIIVASHFDFVYPLAYSDNKGTPASKLKNKRSKLTINLRLNIIILLTNILLLKTLMTNPLFKKSNLITADSKK